MVTIFKATAVRLDCRCLLLLLITDRGIGHDVSVTALINQPRRLRLIAYVMAVLVIMLCGFGYVSQTPIYFSIYRSRKSLAVSGISTTRYQSGDCHAAVCERQESELLGLGNVWPDSLRHILKQAETNRTDD